MKNFDENLDAHKALAKKAQVFDRLIDGQTITFIPLKEGESRIVVIDDTITDKKTGAIKEISYLALRCNTTKGYIALSNFTRTTSSGRVINPIFGLTEFKQLATNLEGQTLTVQMVEHTMNTKWNDKTSSFDGTAIKAVPYFVGVGQFAID